MKTKIIIAVFSMGLFTISTAQAQEMKHEDGKVMAIEKTTYTCSMHPEVKSDKEGDCPKCGMKLTEMEMNHESMGKTYTCTMHSEVLSNEPGDCPKCGMVLVEKKMDMNNEDSHKEHNH